MSIELLQRVLDEMLNSEVFHVTLTGGEPLMNRPALFYAVEFLNRHSVPFGLNSNLTLMTSQDASRLVECGLKGVLTSFASSRPETYELIMQRKGSFEKVIKGIKCSQDAGLFVATSMVLTKTNIGQVYETGKFLHELGVSQFYATKASPPVID
jgi:MoaA/NifB/PqqE/SkfB family radical SAM enzyme